MLKLATLGVIMLSAVFAFQETSREPNDKPHDGGTLPPATYEQSRQLARKTPGYKNLQRIGLAFHGYHEIFGRFPPAVLYGPDQKTQYSWRVELLPVLKHYVDGVESDKLNVNTTREQYNALIQACGYDITAAWDSDTNKQVLQNMPDVYRHPRSPNSETECAYYAVTGPGTAFDETHVSTYTDIKGWVASTLLIVESQSREPWTKPVDILYAMDATVPRIGGFTKDGSLALTCDGAVHFLHATIRPPDLRSLFTRSQEDSFSIVGIPYQYEN